MTVAQLLNSDVVTQHRGTIVRQGPVANSCLLALADSSSHLVDLLGCRLSDVTSGSSGMISTFADGMTVRLSGSASSGSLIYVSSSVGGVGTDAPPDLPVLLGRAYNTYQSGGVWYAELIETPSSPRVPPYVNAQTGTSYQIAATDSSLLCTMVTLDNANPITVTLPKQSTTPLPNGFTANCQQVGAGKVTFSPEDGAVIIQPASTLSISAQWKVVSPVKTDTNTWTLVGSLSS